MIISGKSYHMELSWHKIIWHLYLKVQSLFARLLDVFRFFPQRLNRIFKHVAEGKRTFWENSIQSLFRLRTVLGIGYWWMECILMLLELVGIAELAETVMDFVKINTRPLADWEREMAQQVFGNAINYDRVRIDEYAFIGPKQKQFCYVSFYTINSWGRMHNSILLHELMHVWQFQHLGLVYIPRALRAQQSRSGYNYGGVEKLKAVKAAGKKLGAFNLEQQADIITDYYRIKNGYQPNWGSARAIDLPVYEYFVEQVYADHPAQILHL